MKNFDDWWNKFYDEHCDFLDADSDKVAHDAWNAALHNSLTKELSLLTLKDKDILLVKMTEEYYSADNVKHMIDMVQEVLKDSGCNKQIGILAVREPADVLVMDDETLLDLGLVKLVRMVEKFTDEEMLEFMEKAGFEKTKPFEKILKLVETENEKVLIGYRHYILHTTPEYTMKDLAKLYGVELNDCVDVNNPELVGLDTDLYYHLYPRLDGKWFLPKNKGR